MPKLILKKDTLSYRETMDRSIALEASLASLPNLIPISLVWLVSTDPLPRIVVFFTPVASVAIQAVLRPKPSVKVDNFKAIKIEKDNNIGYRVAVTLSCTGSTVISHVDVKFETDTPISNHYVAVWQVDGKRTIEEHTHWERKDFSALEVEKLRQGDTHEISFPMEEYSPGSGQTQDGKTRTQFVYRFLEFQPNKKHRVHVVVQGERPDSNTYRKKKTFVLNA